MARSADHDLNESAMSDLAGLDDSQDCAVSDITQEATYMTIQEQRRLINNSFVSSSASVCTSANLEPSSLPDDEIERMMLILAEEKARRAQHLAAANDRAPLNVADPASIRKNQKRSKSGGNEAMMTGKKSSTGAGTSGQPASLPSFHTFKQMVAVPPHEAAVDREVERLFQDHAAAPQPAPSTSPYIHGPANTAQTTGGSVYSPAGVTGAPQSRGGSVSRSGAYMPVDKMWGNDVTPSPLVYVETASTNLNGRLSAAPLSDSRSNLPTPRQSALFGSSADEDSHVRTSAGVTPTHGKRLSDMVLQERHRHAEEGGGGHAAVATPIKQQVVHVEQFTPLDAALHHAAKAVRPISGSHQHHAQHGAASSKGPLQVLRPVTRSVSIGSDASSVDGLNLQPAHPHQQQVVARNDASYFDALLVNRELLVSPLCAFDDCLSLGSHGSRRSSTSSRRSSAKVHKADKSPHYLQATSSSVSLLGGKHFGVAPIKKH